MEVQVNPGHLIVSFYTLYLLFAFGVVFGVVMTVLGLREFKFIEAGAFIRAKEKESPCVSVPQK